MDMSQAFYIDDFKILSEKNENYIILWPNIPFWIATTPEGLDSLKLLNGERTVADIAEVVFGNSKSDTVDMLINFFTPLYESEVIAASNDNLGSKIYNSKLPNKPNSVTLLQTMECNLRCKHCCVSEMSKSSFESMDYNSAVNAIQNLEEIMHEGKKTLNFLGGEPLCGDRFYDLIDYAYSRGFEIGLSTNGTLIDENFAKLAKKYNVNVQVSLDGPNKEIHEYIRGKDTWENTIQGIELLKKYDVAMQSNFVYHSKNIAQIEEYFDFVLEHGIKKIRLISLMNMGRAVGNFEMYPVDQFVDRVYDLIKRHPDLIPLLDDTSFMGLVMGAKFSRRMVSCGAGVITITISPNGDIYPCLNLHSNEFKICNIFDNNLIDNFEQSRVRKHFLNSRIENLNSTCEKCDMKFMCGGNCRGETFQKTGDVTAPYPYCDSWKEAMKKIFWILTEYPELGEEKYFNVANATDQYFYH